MTKKGKITAKTTFSDTFVPTFWELGDPPGDTVAHAKGNQRACEEARWRAYAVATKVTLDNLPVPNKFQSEDAENAHKEKRYRYFTSKVCTVPQRRSY